MMLPARWVKSAGSLYVPAGMITVLLMSLAGGHFGNGSSTESVRGDRAEAVVVPDVVAMKHPDAVQMLTDVGLNHKCKRMDEVSGEPPASTIARWVVFAQKPAAGAEVELSSIVTLTVYDPGCGAGETADRLAVPNLLLNILILLLLLFYFWRCVRRIPPGPSGPKPPAPGT
jgi:hypothetical protein